MFRLLQSSALITGVACGALALAQSPAAPAPAPAPMPASTPSAPKDQPLNIAVKSIDGSDVNLASYAGKVVVIVNVASKCGFTKQYAGLEELYKSRKDAGLVVLGFPANNFGNQEPGTDAEIAKFCSTTFGVTFPMFSKVSVKGSDQHPLFVRLAKDAGGEPEWNFTKYLIDRSGKIVGRFGPRTAPDDKAFLARIDELLASPAVPAAPAAAPSITPPATSPASPPASPAPTP
jgi:glutathione peroxidase